MTNEQKIDRVCECVSGLFSDYFNPGTTDTKVNEQNRLADREAGKAAKKQRTAPIGQASQMMLNAGGMIVRAKAMRSMYGRNSDGKAFVAGELAQSAQPDANANGVSDGLEL